jgi:hypothetical protein
LTGQDSNALGIEGLDDLDLLIIECMVKGKSLGETQADLRTVFHTEKLDALKKKISSRYNVIKRSPVLRSLFMAD